MKNFIFGCLVMAAVSFNAQSCPYQKMAEVDSKLYSTKNISTTTFAKISNLRTQGEEKLKNGEIDNAELIFEKALSLFNK
tara:strand:+ start:121 stop:360 length:240 start_codon:yes stop_codon:yes gene_type:complete